MPLPTDASFVANDRCSFAFGLIVFTDLFSCSFQSPGLSVHFAALSHSNNFLASSRITRLHLYRPPTHRAASHLPTTQHTLLLFSTYLQTTLIAVQQALSGLSLAKYVQSSPALMRVLKPVANAYANATGHRQMGLRYDDLLIEESDRVQKAISRLPEKEAYDRAFRLRQAAQLSVLHRELPKEQWLGAKEVSFRSDSKSHQEQAGNSGGVVRIWKRCRDATEAVCCGPMFPLPAAALVKRRQDLGARRCMKLFADSSVSFPSAAVLTLDRTSDTSPLTSRKSPTKSRNVPHGTPSRSRRVTNPLIHALLDTNASVSVPHFTVQDGNGDARSALKNRSGESSNVVTTCDLVV